MSQLVKTCNECGAEKEALLFYSSTYIRKDGTKGLSSYCRSCLSYNKDYYEANKDRITSQARERHSINPELRRSASRKHYANNREAQRERGKLKYQKNKDKDLARIKTRRQKDTETGTSLRGWLIRKYEGTPCMDCEGIFPWCAMDFDHRPDEVKEFLVCSLGHYKATLERKEKWMKEILKCDLVCSSCHRVRTQDRTK